MGKIKTIPCALWGLSEQKTLAMTAKALVKERNELRAIAFDVLKSVEDPSIKHVVYYRDRRRDDDTIWQAHLYYNFPMFTDEQFYQYVEDNAEDNGFVGAVHRHE